jgi:flagellar biosynthetic protein FliR
MQAALLIFTRVGAMTITAPAFSSPHMPATLRAAFSVLITVLLLPTVTARPATTITMDGLALPLLAEAVVGLTLGYLANLLFAVVQMAGEMQDSQSGFGFAGVVDPNFSGSSAILGQFGMVLMWLIYFAVDGHHLLLRALAESFAIVPLGGYVGPQASAMAIFPLATQLMGLALRMAAPVVGAVLLTDLALGMLQRTAPQLNLMSVGFQTKIIVASVVTLASLGFTLALQEDMIGSFNRVLQDFLWRR